MGVVFTPDQQQVIDARDRNILVSAAAGSGKTAVLVERIIQKICDEKHPVDIDRLLIVTFTSAAAAQMRERISRAVMKKLEENPENEHLQKQSALIHNAQITTIDSFCLFIIRNNFNEIGLDPGFRVADEGEIKLLEADILGILLEEEFAKKESGFLQFVESYSTGASEKQIEEAILRLYHFAMSYPFPEEWIEARREDYALSSIEELTRKKWFQGALQYLDTILEESRKRLEKAIELAGSVNGPAQYLDNLEADLLIIERMRSTRAYQELYDLFTYVSFSRLSSKRGEDVNPVLKDMVKAIREEVKKNVADLKKFLFQVSPEDTLADMQVCQGVTEELVRLTLSFKEKLDAAKRDKNIVDFSDMEHFALQILLEKKEDGTLAERGAALEYQDYFEEIMIDEYQDSNEVQELLLKSISGENKGRHNRFMVGDVKQSIYKFRLARPEIFMEKYETYTLNGEENQRIDLSMNFRSRREVTESTNFICGQLMKKAVGNVEYDKYAALYPGASYPEGKADFETELLIAADEDERKSAKEKEACMVAARIKELVGHFPVVDSETGEQRQARYSDIVILFRATAGWAEEFHKILTQQGIPVHVTSKTGYFQTLEIQGILNFLRVLDNPLQDIPFYGVLKLPFIQFTEEEITCIRCSGTDAGARDQKDKPMLYEQVAAFAKQEKAAEEQEVLWRKADNLMRLLEKYRRKVTYTPIRELIQEIIRDTGYEAYMSAMPGGEQRKANMELLLERAGAFEKTSFYGLFHFIRYLEMVQEKEVEFGEANILDENADVVRIMTIHKSKGLEFPICFVAGLAKQFNQMDTRKGILMDAELGIGVDCIDPVLRTKRRTMRKNIVAQRMKEETRGEDLRVLYVALTRAKEKLILTASDTDVIKKINAKLYLTMESEEKLPYSAMMSAGSYYELVMSALMRHACMQELLEENGMAYHNQKLPYQETPIKIALMQEVNPMEKAVREAYAATVLKEKLNHAGSFAEEKLAGELHKRFSFVYPYSYLEGLTVKTTVSELKRAAYEEEAEEAASIFIPEKDRYIPRFMSEETKALGSQYGTAVHKAMELLGFEQKEDTPMIEADIKSWIAQGRLQEAYGKSIRAYKIAEFFKTELSERMIEANRRKQLYKERPFVIGIPANELKDQYPDSEMILIQGVIDVFFQEGEELVLADYKTDRVDSEEELIIRYRAQLDYYQKALEQLTGKRVKERRLYSFALGKEIKI